MDETKHRPYIPPTGTQSLRALLTLNPSLENECLSAQLPPRNQLAPR